MFCTPGFEACVFIVEAAFIRGLIATGDTNYNIISIYVIIIICYNRYIMSLIDIIDIIAYIIMYRHIII